MTVARILATKGREVVAIPSISSLFDAAQLLERRKIGAVLVMDGNDLRGILSERDIVQALALHGGNVIGQAVSKFMTHELVTCGESDSITEVMEIMTRRKVRHLPVMEGERLVGIVSIGDVVKARIEDAEREAMAMREYITAR
jgi:CBS domain-containing protein